MYRSLVAYHLPKGVVNAKEHRSTAFNKILFIKATFGMTFSWHVSSVKMWIALMAVGYSCAVAHDTSNRQTAHVKKSHSITRVSTLGKAQQREAGVNQNRAGVQRVRRTLPTASEQQEYLDVHNRLRRQESASNMELLVSEC